MAEKIPLSLTLAAVSKLNPCETSYTRIAAILPKRGRITAQQAREAGCTFDDIIWVASALAHSNKEIKRRVRHWMADCAAHVLHIYERGYPNDPRPRGAVQAGRDYADGLIGAAARAAAWAAARAAAWAAARDAARDAARAAAGAAAWDAEEQFQFDRLILWLSEEAPEPWPLPATPTEQAA